MIRIEINTDNAAFDGSHVGAEVVRILRDLATTIEEDGLYYQHEEDIRDINGNIVGSIATF